MNTYITKEKINLTIDKEIYQKFREITEIKSINKSKLIENYIKQWLIENGK